MKNLIVISMFIVLVKFASGQIKGADIYGGIGFNSIVNLELNQSLTKNSLGTVNLNFVELSYGVGYSPKKFGVFLEANYSANLTTINRISFQSFRIGPTYKLISGDKIDLIAGCYYSYSGYKVTFRNKEQNVVLENNLIDGNGGSLLFFGRNSSVGAMISLKYKNKYSFRILTDTSLLPMNWQIENNDASGFQPEVLNRIALSFSYHFLNKRNNDMPTNP